MLEIEFDPDKDRANFAKHRVSLMRGRELFEGEPEILQARTVDGERRFREYGQLDGLPHMLVFCVRGRTIRLISLRRARRKEFERHVRPDRR